mmetsp:Transcript_63833/g.149900  ORF Transcript_63833/g.149900 Transcript_63833/m.149900 type:complete len:587 (-) Transcript_63833:169-1929(-)
MAAWLANGGDDALLKAKRKKDEAEKAANGIKKEEIKEEKEEKEEKAEVKSEVKDEEEDDGDALGELLEETDAPAEDRGRKRKRREEEDEGKGLPDLPDVPDVESDTEYPQSEQKPLSSFPSKLRIESCTYEKVNGLYRIMGKHSRGRPAYCKTTNFKDKKTLYLFWFSKKWHIGLEFGSKRCMASLQDVGMPQPPIEPYPGSWKVIPKGRHDKNGTDDKPSKLEKVRCMAMRVIDASVWNESHALQDMEQPLEKDAPAKLKEPDKSQNQKQKQPSQAAQPGATASSSSAKKTPKAASSKKKGPVEQDPEALMVEAHAKDEEDSDDDQKVQANKTSELSSSNEEASDSDSEESSSSDSSEASQKPETDALFEEMNEAARRVITRLRAFDKLQAKSKAIQLFGQLMSRVKKGMGFTNGLDYENVARMRTWCKRQLDADLPEISQKLEPPPPQPAADTGQPRTPPVEDAGANAQREQMQLPHHTQNPDKSVLKKGSVRNTRSVNIVTDSDMTTNILSYKAYGERLWFQAPGSMVRCDGCSQCFPQALGHLKGAKDRSQFAQCEFYCNECHEARFGQNGQMAQVAGRAAM